MENICIRIEWDSGSHEIQNEENYSYEIIDPFLEGCKRYDVYLNYIYDTKIYIGSSVGCQVQEAVTERRKINGINAGGGVFAQGFNPKLELIVPATLANYDPSCKHQNYRVGFRFSYYSDSLCSNLVVRDLLFESYHRLLDYWFEYYEDPTNTIKPPIKLKIIDGGVESIYSINNKNSVQVIEYECGCPPNQLDCGDCCLDCNSIFNQISSIRALVRSLN